MEKNAPWLLKAKEYEKVSLHHVFPPANVHWIWVLLLPPDCVSQELHVASPGTQLTALGTGSGRRHRMDTALWLHPQNWIFLANGVSLSMQNSDKDTTCSKGNQPQDLQVSAICPPYMAQEPMTSPWRSTFYISVRRQRRTSRCTMQFVEVKCSSILRYKIRFISLAAK